MGWNKVLANILFKRKNLSRVQLIEKLQLDSFNYSVETLNDEQQKVIDLQIKMLKEELKISGNSLPYGVVEQPLPEHLSVLNKLWSGKNDSYPFIVVEGSRKYELTERQKATYLCALAELEKGNIHNFLHELCDFIINYRQNLFQTIHPAEFKALSVLIYYYDSSTHI